MKAVLISIQPKWCELIANGKKTVEVRKTKTKLETPFKVYIYCTKPKGKNDIGLCLDNGKVGYVFKRNYETAQHFGIPILSGKVIGEFVCDEIKTERPKSLYASHKTVINSCVPIQEIVDYVGENNFLYFWHISNLVIYDKPRELSEFYVSVKDHWETYDPSKYINGCWKKPLKRPPQSWCYVESGGVE